MHLILTMGSQPGVTQPRSKQGPAVRQEAGTGLEDLTGLMSFEGPSGGIKAGDTAGSISLTCQAACSTSSNEQAQTAQQRSPILLDYHAPSLGSASKEHGQPMQSCRSFTSIPACQLSSQGALILLKSPAYSRLNDSRSVRCLLVMCTQSVPHIVHTAGYPEHEALSILWSTLTQSNHIAVSLQTVQVGSHAATRSSLNNCNFLPWHTVAMRSCKCTLRSFMTAFWTCQWRCSRSTAS